MRANPELSVAGYCVIYKESNDTMENVVKFLSKNAGLIMNESDLNKSTKELIV